MPEMHEPTTNSPLSAEPQEGRAPVGKCVEEKLTRLMFPHLPAHAARALAGFQRWKARRLRSKGPFRHNATILIVNYRTLAFTRACIEAIEALTPEPHEVIVVDNNSKDASASYLRSLRHIRLLEVGFNMGHGYALDWASTFVDTEFFVSMDSDARPVRLGWLSDLLTQLKNETACSGIYHQREYVHPSCLAIRTADFRRNRLSFQANYPSDGDSSKLGKTHWDVGEQISMKLRSAGKKLHYFPLSNKPAHHMVGGIYGGIVFHHWYGTRVRVEGRCEFDGMPVEAIVSDAPHMFDE
jgi:hypothetical protein